MSITLAPIGKEHELVIYMEIDSWNLKICVWKMRE